MSDTSLTAFEKDGHYAAVIAEANANAQNHAFSSFVCVLALSSVIGCPIEFYFPISDDHVSQQEWDSLQQEWDSLQKMFNCCIDPRQICNMESEKSNIFRCAAMPLNYL